MEKIGYCSFCSVYTRVPKNGGREIGNHQLQYLLLFFHCPRPVTTYLHKCSAHRVQQAFIDCCRSLLFTGGMLLTSNQSEKSWEPKQKSVLKQQRVLECSRKAKEISSKEAGVTPWTGTTMDLKEIRSLGLVQRLQESAWPCGHGSTSELKTGVISSGLTCLVSTALLTLYFVEDYLANHGYDLRKKIIYRPIT